MAKWWNDNFGPREEGGLADIALAKRQQQRNQGLKDAAFARAESRWTPARRSHP